MRDPAAATPAGSPYALPTNGMDQQAAVDPSSTALTTSQPRSLLAVSFADPNRISTTFKPGEIWSTAKDGATGLDGKMKKKLWNRLKKEVIYRDSPEELEQKQRDAEKRQALEYHDSDEYKERVAVDLAAARLKLLDRAKELGLEPGKPYVPPPTPPESEDDEDEEREDDVDTPSRQDLLLARVLTEQRVLAQLRPGAAQPLTKEPPGLDLDMKALAIQAAEAKKAELKAAKNNGVDDGNDDEPHAAAKSDSSPRSDRQHHHHKRKRSRYRDDDSDDDRRRDHRHRRRRRD